MSPANPTDASVTLDEVLSIVAAKRVPLAAELAGYLILEMTERLDPNGGNVDPKIVFVSEEGAVALVRTRRTSSGDVEASLREILSKLLESSSSQAPALSAAARRPAGAGLSGLAEELETALIPVNRSAGRRALGRLARETRRVILGVARNAPQAQTDARAARGRVPGPVAPPERTEAPRFARDREEEPTTARRPVPEGFSRSPPARQEDIEPRATQDPGGTKFSQNEVDDLIEQFGVSSGGDRQHARALGNIVGLEPTPPPLGSAVVSPTTSQPVARDSDVESLLAMGSDRTGSPPPPAHRAAPAPRRPVPSVRPPLVSLPDEPRARGSWAVALLGLAAVGAGAFALVQVRASLASHLAPPAPAAAPAPSAIPVAPACIATLVVTGAPDRAEVLLGEGQAPADVEKVPVGARLEFVATAEGYAPKRVVVPAGQAWDSGPDGKPRYETAVQLDKSRARAGQDNWPPGEPGTEVGGQGPPGTVHVVATPRGAEIWMLAGLGGETRIEHLSCDRDWDVLIAGPTTFRRRLHVPTSAFVLDVPDDASAASPPRTVGRVARVRAD